MNVDPLEFDIRSGLAVEILIFIRWSNSHFDVRAEPFHRHQFKL
jgi:hypothetical protein